MRALETRREHTARLLADQLGAIGRLRAEVERAGDGAESDAMGAALRSAEACLRSVDLTPPVKVSAPRDA